MHYISEPKSNWENYRTSISLYDKKQWSINRWENLGANLIGWELFTKKRLSATFPDEDWDDLATSDSEVERVLLTAVGLVVSDSGPSSSHVDALSSVTVLNRKVCHCANFSEAQATQQGLASLVLKNKAKDETPVQSDNSAASSLETELKLEQEDDLEV